MPADMYDKMIIAGRHCQQDVLFQAKVKRTLNSTITTWRKVHSDTTIHRHLISS